MRKLIQVVLLVHFCTVLSAQARRPDMTFGNIKPEDFTPVTYSIDTNAAAVYLFDVGVTYFHEDASTHNEEVYQRHTRIRILNKNAFELATLAIPLYNMDEDEQKIEDLRAATYNISNGKIIAEPIDKNVVFKQKTKGVKVIKFTLPNVKEGSIIEFSYTIKTPGIGIPGWNFQGKYPRLWSEYEVVIPYFYDYAVLKQGNSVFNLDSTFTFHSEYSYYAYKPDEDNTLQHIWAMQNVPAFISEPFTYTRDNYIAKIEFQLSAYKNGAGQYINYNRSWSDVCLKLMRNLAFGYDMMNENKRVTDIVKEVSGNATQNIDKAKIIFNYVRDNYTCTDYDGKYLSQEMKKTIESKRGNVADINLLLAAMLMNADLTVYPVLLSTTDNGKINYTYPVLSKYNYVICQLIVDKKQYLLDASRKYLSFGKLSNECYNGYAQVINVINPQGIFISPNSLNENITTTASINNGAKKATVTTRLSAQPSIELKKQLGNVSSNGYSAILKQSLLNETSIDNLSVNGITGADSTISITYDVPLEFGNEAVIYFSPLLAVQSKSNPFAAAKRTYPVELSYCKEENYQLTMEVPQGYQVDELPAPAQIKLKDDTGVFDYAIAKNGNTIQLQVKIKLSKAVYEPDDYQLLRDFYTSIITKEAEPIVFKKTN